MRTRLLLLVMMPAVAHAEEPAPPESTGAEREPGEASGDDWHLTIEALTDIPVMVGGRVGVEAPGRVRFGTSVGFMPSSYVDIINSTAETFDWYGEATATLIETIVQNSLILRLHAGWHPWAERGFYFEGGYTLGIASGNAVGQDTIAGASGADSPDADENRELDADTTIHMADVEVGWQWKVVDDVWVRTALGGAFTLAADSVISRNFNTSGPNARLWDAFEEAGELYVIDVLETYAHTVVLSVAVGYRLF